MAEFNNFNLSLIIFLAAFCCRAEPGIDFAYFGSMGPDHWSEYFNQCSGKHQSPININEVDVVNRYYSKMSYKEFSKLPLAASLLNNGHTVLLRMTYEGEMPKIAYGPLGEKDTYQFQQLHFHWGEDNTAGSEDRINNVAYPMELHAVFRNSKYESFEEAALKDDGITVLAAFYEVGNRTSLEYDHLTRNLEHIHEPHTNVTLTQPMHLFSLLPNDLSKYYTYIGSLTTPPCSENVIWIDLINPIIISPELIARFRYLKTFDGSSLTHNFRPVQPLNNRKVYRAVVQESKTRIEYLANGVSKTIRIKSSVSNLIILFVILPVLFNVNTHLYIL